jgi:hypothetical protein
VMPDEFNAQALVIATAVLILLLLWSRDGWI